VFGNSAFVTNHEFVLRRDLLQNLLWAYGPGGQEDAVRDICRRELEPFVDRRGLTRPATWSAWFAAMTTTGGAPTDGPRP